MTTAAGPDVGIATLEHRLARLLQRGVLLAVGLLVVGMVLMLGRGLSPLDLPPRLDPAELLGDVLTLHPAGYVWLGTIALLCLPVARLFVAVASLWAAGERSSVAVGFGTLGLIALGVVVGLASGG